MEREGKWIARKRGGGLTEDGKKRNRDKESPFILWDGKVYRSTSGMISDEGKYINLTPELERKGWKAWREKRKWRKRELSRIRELYKNDSIYKQRAWLEKG